MLSLSSPALGTATVTFIGLGSFTPRVGCYGHFHASRLCYCHFHASGLCYYHFHASGLCYYHFHAYSPALGSAEHLVNPVTFTPSLYHCSTLLLIDCLPSMLVLVDGLSHLVGVSYASLLIEWVRCHVHALSM